MASDLTQKIPFSFLCVDETMAGEKLKEVFNSKAFSITQLRKITLGEILVKDGVVCNFPAIN